MATLVMVLRMIAVVVFAGGMLLHARARGDERSRNAASAGPRVPLMANFAAFVLFFAALLFAPRDSTAVLAVPLAFAGCGLALAGVALVFRSRAELGAAWSLVPRANERTGLVTTGPYRLVRHPIYLGFTLLALGEALAFASWVALGTLLFAILPSFIWRAHVEEAALGAMFGERHAQYRRQTRLLIPYVI